MNIGVVIEKIRKHGFLAEFFTYRSMVQFKRYLITGFLSFGFEYGIFTLLFLYQVSLSHLDTARFLLAVARRVVGFLWANPEINPAPNMTQVDMAVAIANTAAYVTVFWFNFLMNRFWSFQARGRFGRQLLLYFAIFVFNLFAINILMYFLTSVLGLHPLVSKIPVMGAVVCWNFVIYKKVIYK